MSTKKFALVADISTDDPAKVQDVLAGLVGVDAILRTDSGFWVKTTMEGRSASELNRTFLSALRRFEARVRLRAEWTNGNTRERFTDFDPRGRRETTSDESVTE